MSEPCVLLWNREGETGAFNGRDLRTVLVRSQEARFYSGATSKSCLNGATFHIENQAKNRLNSDEHREKTDGVHGGRRGLSLVGLSKRSKPSYSGRRGTQFKLKPAKDATLDIAGWRLQAPMRELNGTLGAGICSVRYGLPSPKA